MSSFVAHPHPNVLSAEQRADLMADPGFGQVFSDHMAWAAWTPEDGWHDRSIRPYAPLQLDPASAIFHYAQEVFEGLKAYRHADGSIWAFRPEMNARRMADSATRLALPPLSEDDFLGSVQALVEADRDWVPGGGEQSYYLRPFMIGVTPAMAVKPSRHVLYAVIGSPSGAYFAAGVKPVSIWLTRDYARAGAGGTGAAKCGGNYASSMVAQLEAEANGCDQVAFVDSVSHSTVEELGGMNIMAITDDGELHTPELTGTILPGVTRASIIELAGDHGLRVVERRVPLDGLLDDIDSGRVTELFACGTAAVINPIRLLKDVDGSHLVADGEAGETTMALREHLTDLQYGRRPDDRGWLRRLV